MELVKVVSIVGLYFLILLTSSSAFQTIVTRIYESEGDYRIGPYIFMLQYAAFMIMNLFVPLLRYSYKWMMTLSALCYAFNNATGFFVIDSGQVARYIIAGFGAIINGMGGVFLWISASRYLHNACHHYQKE